MISKIKYEFTAKVWQHSPPGGWYFISLPEELSKEIRENLKWMEEGWGRLKASAQIGSTKWDSAIWFDTKKKTYLLPLKSEIRKRENISADEIVNLVIWI